MPDAPVHPGGVDAQQYFIVADRLPSDLLEPQYVLRLPVATLGDARMVVPTVVRCLVVLVEVSMKVSFPACRRSQRSGPGSGVAVRHPERCRAQGDGGVHGEDHDGGAWAQQPG